MKIQLNEKKAMALKFTLSKFGPQVLMSGLSLSDFLKSSEITTQLPNGCGIFNRIGNYYDNFLDDDTIRELLNNGNFGREFELQVSSYVKCNTMEEVITDMNQKKACRALDKSDQNSSTSIFSLNFFRTSPTTTKGSNDFRTLLLNESSQIEQMDLESEEVGFTNGTKYSCLQMPFTSDQLKTPLANNTSRIISVNTTRYTKI